MSRQSRLVAAGSGEWWVGGSGAGALERVRSKEPVDRQQVMHSDIFTFQHLDYFKSLEFIMATWPFRYLATSDEGNCGSPLYHRII